MSQNEPIWANMGSRLGEMEEIWGELEIWAKMSEYGIKIGRYGEIWGWEIFGISIN